MTIICALLVLLVTMLVATITTLYVLTIYRKCDYQMFNFKIATLNKWVLNFPLKMFIEVLSHILLGRLFHEVDTRCMAMSAYVS